nr:beta-glucosidase 18-like [Tanacetum cinerariifolium]
MRQFLGNQLPRFSTAETNFMKDNIDFIAVNHYSSTYAKDCIHSSCSATATRPISGFFEGVSERDGVQIGEPTGIGSLPIVPVRLW